MKSLEGIKVLDLTHALSGPFCTYQLGLLGADVIKIEKPGVGDDFRDFARPDDWEVGPAFVAANGGKRSLTVDLKNPKGMEIVRKLAAVADVVVENQRPGALKKMGLGWEDLKKINPKLVYASISGYGQEGEMALFPAYDHTIQAVSGMSWTGRDDDTPTQGRGFSIDCFSGYVAYASILSALLRRERTGEGQYLDVAMLDSAMVLMGVGMVRQMITGDSQSASQPVVHERPTVAAYKTRDGWLWLSANFDNHWQALCKVINAPDLAADPRFATVRSRAQHSKELRAVLAERFAPLSAVELEGQLAKAGCPASLVRTSRDALKVPSLTERGMLQSAKADANHDVVLMNAGFVADKDGPGLQGPVPTLGQDTDAVLTELGYGADEVKALRDAGAV